MSQPNRAGFLLALPAIALASCTSNSAPALTSEEVRAVTENYAAGLHAAYEDSATGARALDAALDAFLAAPSQATLDAARSAWIASRPSYLQTEVARFYDGPIDDPETGPEGMLNAWPLDEAYIDYVQDGAGSPMHVGIVNDPEILATIDASGLSELNQADSEENVATGYHAIEFLLWGQDLRADGAGERPFSDYVEGGDAMNVDRRRAYLTATSALLIEQIEEVQAAWAPGASDNYRAEMVAAADEDPREPLRRILFGMGSLSGAELAGERMNVAYMTKEQEDEHSCFSDTTPQDHLNDAIGIRNAYLGTYTRTDGSVVSGASLSDLVASRDPELDTRLRAELDASIDAIRAIPAPFDQAILGADDAPGRVAIRAAVDALRAQTSSIAEVAALFDVPLNLEE